MQPCVFCRCSNEDHMMLNGSPGWVCLANTCPVVGDNVLQTLTIRVARVGTDCPLRWHWKCLTNWRVPQELAAS